MDVMRRAILAACFIGLNSAASADGAISSPGTPILPGIYSSEEQRYFAKELGKPDVPLIRLKVDNDRRLESINAFGLPVHVPIETRSFTYGAPQIDATLTDATALALRRARPATCWAAISKKQLKADSSPDWYFVRNVKLHDQGGRAIVGGGTSGVDPLVICMRNVVWPPSTDGKPANRPSLVRHDHKPEQPDHAESYVWVDRGAARIGVNLQWMQASCGIDCAEPNS